MLFYIIDTAKPLLKLLISGAVIYDTTSMVILQYITISKLDDHVFDFTITKIYKQYATKPNIVVNTLPLRTTIGPNLNIE